MPAAELTPIYQARLARLRGLFEAAGIDALLVSQPHNRRYLSGFTGSTGWLLITRDEALFAADFRYYEQVGLECPGYELVRFGATGRGFADEALPALLAHCAGQRVGFEADHLTYHEFETWSAQAGPARQAGPAERQWVPTTGLVKGLRAVKDADEIGTLRAAIKLGDEALAAALAEARPGMTERELAWLIESYIRTHGAESLAFDTIVGVGPHGAQPHHQTGDAPLVAGEPIVIDMGARLRGYCSDLTRTVCLGQPNDAERFWEVYNTVLQAQLAAEALARAGVSGQAVDASARDLITQAGYGPNFGHGLGHGVGLFIHEEPGFNRSNIAPLVPGNVVTVEPGIYLPGWGGVRIEDIVLITEDGAEVLTTAPKEPII
jgi:Xaa-Pro aminopeptidase